METTAEERSERAGTGTRVRRVLDATTGHPVLFVFVLALVIRIATVLVVDQLPAGTFALDDSTYSGMARDVVLERRGVWDPYTHQLYRATFAFVAPLTVVYSVFGVFSAAGELFVATVGAAVAALVTFNTQKVTAPRWALLAGLGVALLPSQVLWSSLLLKDPSVWLGLGALAAVAAVAARAKTIGWLVVLSVAAAGFLFYLAFLREHTLVVAAWSLPVAMLFSAKDLRLQRVAGASALMVVVPWIVGIGPAGLSLVTNAGALEMRRALNAQHAASAFVDDEPETAQVESPETEALQGDISLKQQMAAELEERARELKEKAEAAEDGAGGVSATAEAARQKAEAAERELEELRVGIAADEARLKELVGGADAGAATGAERLDPDLVHLPKGLFVMLFEPVPWSTEGSTTMRAARVEALVWYPLLGLALIGLVRARRMLWALTFPILAGGGMLVVYALTEGNIGTAYRHRGEFVWVVCILAGLGAAEVATWRARRRVGVEEER